MGDWRREPTLHFLLLGAALAVVGVVAGSVHGPGDTSGSPNPTADRTIVVRGDQVERLGRAWESRWHRPPTAAELDRLVDDWVRQEVLYRSALELGLERGDDVVRRRLVEKMELLSIDARASREPTESELRERYEAEPLRWAAPELRSYTHIFFSEDARGEAAWHDARETLEDLNRMAPSPDRAPELGDRFVMQHDYPDRSRAEVARHMGEHFAEELFAIEDGTWHGPERSEYGIHLVRIVEATQARPLDFDQAREAIRETLRRERMEGAEAQFYEQLRSKFEIVRGNGG